MDRGVWAEEEFVLALGVAEIQVGDGHRRCANGGSAINFCLVLGGERRIRTAQPLARDREPAIATAFGDAGLLQKREGAATGTDKDKFRSELHRTAGREIAGDDLPRTVALLAQIGNAVLEVASRARLRERSQKLASENAEIDIGAGVNAGGGHGRARISARHHQRSPSRDLRRRLGVRHLAEKGRPPERGEAPAKIANVCRAGDEAHVRDAVDEVAGSGDDAAPDKRRP